MRVSLPAVALALPALTVSLAALAAPVAGDAPAAAPNKAVVENVTAEQSLTVVRDRAPGQLRAPTPDELQKLIASGRQRTPSVQRDIRSHTGAPGVALGNSMLKSDVVRKDANGRIELSHDKEAARD